MLDERRDLSGAVDISTGAETVLLLTMQKRSSSWISVDPVRRLQYW